MKHQMLLKTLINALRNVQAGNQLKGKPEQISIGLENDNAAMW